MNLDMMKKQAGEKAAEWVENGMIVGLGTGSTVFYFINKLIEKVADGLKIQVVSSSIRSMEQAKKGKIPIADLDTLTSIHLTVDGADEIDPQKYMIKGGGGALLREKILANFSQEMVVIVDETKVVKQLGKQLLPIEILPFGKTATIDKISKLGYHGYLRTQNNNTLYKTDNGNLIFDIHFPTLLDDPTTDHDRLIRIPGVLETGFFFNLASHVLIGKSNGIVETLS